jgi:ABC-type Fe3+/spermidine/putrescine transport system ATPase subunit
MPHIQIKKANKYILSDVDLEIRDKEFLVLLGPNGSGKTTLLNIIAGLTDYTGSVSFDGTPVDKVAASKRQVGYLFQDLVLFPHLDVSANIKYGLRNSKQTATQIEARLKELLDLMKISHISSRYPKHLSGGEKQRVALARALAVSPSVLLLDEPLSSLDPQTAKYLRTELRHIQRNLGITMIYVTHDLQEAEEIAHRIAILQDGCIEQTGRPEEVFFYPANEKVSEFIGAPNILECDYCRTAGHGVVEVGCGGLPIIVPHDGDQIHKIALLPRDIYISDTKPPGPEINRFNGIVTGIKVNQESVRVNVRAGGNNLLAEIPHHIFIEQNITEGKEVFLILKLRRMRIHENKYLRPA